MKKINEDFLKKIENSLEEKNCDAVILNQSSDVFYYTGFNSASNSATLFITKNKRVFITDGRFVNQFKEQVDGFDLVVNKKLGDTYQLLKNIIKENNINNLLFSFNDLSYQNFKELELDNINLVDAGSLFQEIRRVKTEEELSHIKSACKINEEAFFATLDQIKPGLTEKDIRNILNNEIMTRGSEGFAFPTIVASGPTNGALPHAIPTDRKIEVGDFITIDFGAIKNRYKADNTRTIAVGEVNDELMKIYNIVLETKNECSKLVKPGVKTQEVHNYAANKIKDAGYELPHGLGHGLGVDNHELPRMANSYESTFKENDVITIEPGIYVLETGGVRIEDDYVVTKDGVENLTPNITTDLITI